MTEQEAKELAKELEQQAAGFQYRLLVDERRPLPTGFEQVYGKISGLDGTITHYIPLLNNTILIIRENGVKFEGCIMGVCSNFSLLQPVNVTKKRTGEFTYSYLYKYETPLLDALIQVAPLLVSAKRYGTLADLIALTFYAEETGCYWLELDLLCIWHKGEVIKVSKNIFSSTVIDLFFSTLPEYEAALTPNENNNNIVSVLLTNIILYDGKLPSLEIDNQAVVTLPFEETKELVFSIPSLEFDGLIYVGATDSYIATVYENRNNSVKAIYYPKNL